MTNIEFFKSFGFIYFSFSRERINKIDSAHGNFFALMLEGSAVLTSKKEEIKVKKGDVLFIPERLKYQSHWIPDKDGNVSFLSLRFDQIPDNSAKHYILQTIPCTEEEKELLRFINENLVVNSTTVGALYSFLGKVEERMLYRETEKNEAVLDKALEFMENNTQCSVTDIARFCNRSETAVYNLFKEKLGKTPVEIKHKILCRKAHELLSGTDLSVEDISEKLGFSSSIYFRKILKQQMGKTPSQVRKESLF